MNRPPRTPSNSGERIPSVSMREAGGRLDPGQLRDAIHLAESDIERAEAAGDTRRLTRVRQWLDLLHARVDRDPLVERMRTDLIRRGVPEADAARVARNSFLY